MSDDLRSRADARLERALETAPIRDPRPWLRPILKHLREHDPAAFARAIEHFESRLLPAVAGEGDPLAEWLEYGHVLATLAGAGRQVAVDGTGRAVPAESAVPADALLLHVPDDGDTPVTVLRCPRNATPAQEASIELLVLGRLNISDQLSAISGQSPDGN